MTNSKPDDSSAKADDGDWLGYGAYADALWGRIQTALIKSEGDNAVLGDDPLVIGVFGEWGAGKSKLLSLMQDRSRAWAKERIGWRKRDGGNFGLTVPVYFQPWKYEHEEHLHVPILLHILAALKQELAAAQTWGEWAGGKVPEGITKHMDAAVALFGLCLAGTAVAMDSALPLVSRAGLASAGLLSKLLPKVSRKPVDSNPADALTYTDTGRYFYEIHEALKAITRPKQHAKYLQGVNLHADLPINFVIFIDDLDRCLPEKAVQTLELIKTIFNAESFAFVLALDDEVIERGIGHRYKDYELLNKKPSMPITGFEYLEKIVHLPFKLPALTPTQARNFVQRLETQIAGADKAAHWFRPIDDINPQAKFRREELGDTPFDGGNKQAAKSAAMAGGATFTLEIFDLLAIALAGFDAFVPRKLTRMVELWHATVHVAQLRHKNQPLKEEFSPSSAAQLDVRIAFALMMVQLFHPDLYRVLRRHDETFKTLYDGFDGSKNNLWPRMSDIDLWHWAAYVKQGQSGNRPTSAGETLALIASLEFDQRYPAQQKRLPLVECLVAHRMVQRHVFDALKLLDALKLQMQKLPDNFHIAQYFSMLAQYDADLTPPRPLNEAPKNPPPTELPNGRFAPRYPQQLLADLVADDEGTQQAMVKNAPLEPDKFLTQYAVDELCVDVNAWLNGKYGEEDQRPRKRLQLLRGLKYLAPFIFGQEGQPLWELASGSVDTLKDADPKYRALWGDVRAALGADPRFETDGLCLAKKGVNDPATGFNTSGDVVPGFVFIHRVKEDFWFGDGYKESPKPVLVPPNESEFYISRTLTTVAQYAKFLDSATYETHFLGDGKTWFERDRDEGKRKSGDPKQLKLPREWQEQLANRLRPVTGVTWFETSAYVDWFNGELGKHALGAYTASLPTELQWECAVRFQDQIDAEKGPRIFPWSKGPQDASLSAEHFANHANIAQLVGHPTTVGLFPQGHSGMGLTDMAGNVWEWMANRYVPGYDPTQLANADKEENRYSLRGGSWFYLPGGARCSSRDGLHPDLWLNGVGFRVVLSLAN
jgi:formylglycine-generating enzyme required for sulfatase activity